MGSFAPSASLFGGAGDGAPAQMSWAPAAQPGALPTAAAGAQVYQQMASTLPLGPAAGQYGSSAAAQQPASLQPGWVPRVQGLQHDAESNGSSSSPSTSSVMMWSALPGVAAAPSRLHGRHMPPTPSPNRNRTLFFAGVNPVVTAATLVSLFQQYGCVLDLNLFYPYRGAGTSKGCGLVVFSAHHEAAAAMAALHDRFVWPGARSPMVIEWSDPDKQHKKRRATGLAHTTMVQHTTMVAPSQLQQHAHASILCPPALLPGLVPQPPVMPGTTATAGQQSGAFLHSQ